MEKVELVIKRIKLEAFFYEQGNNKYIPKNYGLKRWTVHLKLKRWQNLRMI